MYLHKIQKDINNLCQVMSTVIGVNIEIIDSNMTRLAGTGIYSDQIGLKISPASGIYEKVFDFGQTIYVDNPREHSVCLGCQAIDNCFELLNLSTPIELDNAIIGVIGLVCFDEDEKKRVIEKRSDFTKLVEQISKTISFRAMAQKGAEKTRLTLGALMEVSSFSHQGLMILSRDDTVSYVNQAAIEELNLTGDYLGIAAKFRDIGNNLGDISEFELTLGSETRVIFGRLKSLESTDDDFHLAFLTEPISRLSHMLSQVGASGGSLGGLKAIIGTSSELTKLKEKVLRIASTSSTVLITGESGTGKEMFARAIHSESQRRDGPFVAINCGAIPDELLESELFGYVRGAFTGASQTGRIGKFELANTGVIFLDEISSMSLYLQVKLLRVLQEKNFTRLGSNRTIDVDVRVIAATNEDLPGLIKERRFRGDLYYRLNVIPLELPPLRNRIEDIPILAEYFLDRYCRRFNKPPARLTPLILDSFLNYQWPGNVREFENCIEYMVNLHESGPLTESLIPPSVSGKIKLDQPAKERPGPPPDDPSPIVTLEELEGQAILRALAKFGDTTDGKRMAAKALGIGLATLYRKLQHLKLEAGDT
jgi:transcriptional regulator with PAS, ATPase and Fis domain